MPDKDPKFDIPKGRDPGEFLNDADLVTYYERQLAAMKPDDPKRPDLIRYMATIKRSARATADSVDLTHALGESELAAQK